MSHKITRRKFIGTSLAVGGAAAGAIALSGCSNSGGGTSEKLVASATEVSPQANIEYLEVDPTQVLSYTGMSEAATEDYLKLTNSFSLPLGSLVYQSTDRQALVLAPGASSNALTRLGLVDLDNGELTTVLGQALGYSEDYIIYDARASSNALIWVECNMVHGLWRVYAAPMSNGQITEAEAAAATLLDQGDALYEPPLLAAATDKVYWTVMPDPNGEASTKDSYLKCADIAFGVETGVGAGSGVNTSSSTNSSTGAGVDSSTNSSTGTGDGSNSDTNSGANSSTSTSSKTPVARSIYTSHGRMITNPQISGDTVAIVPRVPADAVYYQLTTLGVADDKVRDVAILPPSLRVSDAVWLGSGFAFCIENNYDYAKGLAYFGTYQQLGEGRYMHVNKVPTSAPVSVNSIMYVKSTKNVIGLDTANGHAIIVDTPTDCVSYGDILAGVDQQNRLVTYTTVTSRLGQEKGICQVRVFDAL